MESTEAVESIVKVLFSLGFRFGFVGVFEPHAGDGLLRCAAEGGFFKFDDDFVKFIEFGEEADGADFVYHHVVGIAHELPAVQTHCLAVGDDE